MENASKCVYYQTEKLTQCVNSTERVKECSIISSSEAYRLFINCIIREVVLLLSKSLVEYNSLCQIHKIFSNNYLPIDKIKNVFLFSALYSTPYALI